MTLRMDVAHQLARRLKHLGGTQLELADRLGIPQPTLSKIANGRVADLSLELLIRIAVLADLPLTLQTGRVPEEAGAFLPACQAPRRQSPSDASPVPDASRQLLAYSERALTPTQRLEAFLEHNQVVAELRAGDRRAEAERMRAAQPR